MYYAPVIVVCCLHPRNGCILNGHRLRIRKSIIEEPPRTRTGTLYMMYSRYPCICTCTHNINPTQEYNRYRARYQKPRSAGPSEECKPSPQRRFPGTRCCYAVALRMSVYGSLVCGEYTRCMIMRRSSRCLTSSSPRTSFPYPYD